MISPSRIPVRASTVLALFVLAACGGSLMGFNCKQISQFTELFLQRHYSATIFSDESSRRTLENLLKTLDPAKLYLLEEDVEELRAQYAKTLDDAIARRDCSAINTILQKYATRFDARQSLLEDLIAAEYDYTVDEYYDADRKSRQWAATDAELDERWRKRIKYQLLQLSERYDMDEARDKLRKRYDLSRKYLSELDAVEVASLFLNAFAGSMDPHTRYLSPDELEDFRISSALSLEGIGARLRSEYGIITIESLIPGGPADRGGELQPDDRIIAVAQVDGEFVDVMDMELRDAVKLIRGKRGSEVRLLVGRDATGGPLQKTITIIRDKIELKESEARGYTFAVQNGGNALTVGYIYLPSFYLDFAGRSEGDLEFKSCSADVERILGRLKEEGMDALVLDLRYNTGGSLDEAVNIAGLFIDEGPVVQVRHASGKRQVLADVHPGTTFDGPLVIFANHRSASSSEILAGAIQDYGRGLIVGDSRTFGKGTVQKLEEVSGGKFGAVKVTISQFFRPSGSSTQVLGVASDIALPTILEELEIGEDYYDYRLDWHDIEPAEFEKQGALAAFLPELAEHSRQRVAGDEDFSELAEEIEKYRAEKAERYRISLKREEAPDDTAETAAADTDAGAPAEAGSADAEDADTESADDVSGGDAGDGDAAEDKRPDVSKDFRLREVLAIASDLTLLDVDKEPGEVLFPELAAGADSESAEADSEPAGAQ